MQLMVSLRLEVLGSGAPVPTGDRVQTGLLVETDETRVLIDCGSGVLHRLVRSETDIVDIPTVMLTHHHLDHVGDLFPLLKARLFRGESSVRIVGPEGTADLVETMLDAYEYLRGALELTVEEVAPESFSVDGFDVIATESRHVLYCLAYRIRPEGADAPSITFSGDSVASADVAALANGSTVLVHDCAYSDAVPDAPHATPSELGRVLDDVRVDRVYLTHLAPETDGRHDEMLDAIGEHYDGEVRMARDGLDVDVGHV